MRRRLFPVVLILCLLAAGVLVFRAGITAPSEEAVTRMAALGLVLLDSEEGVSVLAVRDQSPAERAGIQPGDVLLQANGMSFETILQLEEMLQGLNQQNMQLQLLRRQEELVTVKLSLK